MFKATHVIKALHDDDGHKGRRLEGHRIAIAEEDIPAVAANPRCPGYFTCDIRTSEGQKLHLFAAQLEAVEKGFEDYMPEPVKVEAQAGPTIPEDGVGVVPVDPANGGLPGA